MMQNYLVKIMLISLICCRVIADSKPTVLRMYGTAYTSSVARTQSVGTIDQLALSEEFGTKGSITIAQDLNKALVAGLIVDDAGCMVVVASDESDSYVYQYQPHGELDTTFAIHTGYCATLLNKAGAHSILFDDERNIIIAGDGGARGYPWIAKVTRSGDLDPSFVFQDSSFWTQAGSIEKIALQSNGKIIAVGSNGLHAVVACYQPDGLLDKNFGRQGHSIFDGTIGYPLSSYVLQNIVIYHDDALYTAYVDAGQHLMVIRLTSLGMIDSKWNQGLPVQVSWNKPFLGQPVSVCMVLDASDRLIIAGSPDQYSVIEMSVIDASDGKQAILQSPIMQTHDGRSLSYVVRTIIATQQGKIYCAGSDSDTQTMMVMCMAEQGLVDASFHEKQFCNVQLFLPVSQIAVEQATIVAMALDPTGKIMTVGYQTSQGVSQSYISCLCGQPYDQQVLQYPVVQHAGLQDKAFAASSDQLYPGVMVPYIGKYKDQLQQKAKAIVELNSGNLLVGQTGYIDTSSVMHMMLIRLTCDGYSDEEFGNRGSIILPNLTGSDEILTHLTCDADDNVYVTGYCLTGAIFRKYSKYGSLLWNADYQQAGCKAFACHLAGLDRVFLLVSVDKQIGQIHAYQTFTGKFDTTFHAAGSMPGILGADAYDLNLGPLYASLVDTQGLLYIAYKNSKTQTIDIAALLNTGAGLMWHTKNIYPDRLGTADNIKLTFMQDGNLAVAAGSESQILVTSLLISNGSFNPVYQQPLTLSCNFVPELTVIVGVSDDSLLVAGYDVHGSNILVSKINSVGKLDTTFYTKVDSPGIAQVALSKAYQEGCVNVACGMIVQSKGSGVQGHIVIAGYQQLGMYRSRPMIFRMIGTVGTTQVHANPGSSLVYPGKIDTSYGDQGYATLVLGLSNKSQDQKVCAIRSLPGTQLLAVLQDQSSSIAFTQRLCADGAIDTIYADGAGIAMSKLQGKESIYATLCDGSGNVLITGSHEIYGGFVKRILPTGLHDPLFGGYTGQASTKNYPVGTTYGLMDVVYACQQLQNGNLVIAGSCGSDGIIQMLTPSGSVMTAFGVSGMFRYGQAITSLSVDTQDMIYAVATYKDTLTGNIQATTIKLTAQGQYVAAFGQNGIAPVVLSDLARESNVYGAYDAQQRMILAGVCADKPDTIILNRCTLDGMRDMRFHQGMPLRVSLTGAGKVVLTRLVTLRNNKIIIAGYQGNALPTGNTYFVLCVNELGELDATFGNGMYSGLIHNIGLTILTDLHVQPDGNILLSGQAQAGAAQQIPLTCRLHGFENVQSVAQSVGYKVGLPSGLNLYFNQTGIARTNPIPFLKQGGVVATDKQGRVIVAGATSDGHIVLARFLANGSLDTGNEGSISCFGSFGLAQTNNAIQGLIVQSISIDAEQYIYVAGYTCTGRFVLAKFNEYGCLDTSFGVNGIALSSSFLSLSAGGYLAVDSNNRLLITGSTKDGHLVAIRLLSNGNIDPSFAVTADNQVRIRIDGLQAGAGVVVDRMDNIYVGGYTSFDQCVLVKLKGDGSIDDAYGTAGRSHVDIAQGILQGISLTIDRLNRVIFGGITTQRSFFVVRCTPAGLLDTGFNATGIAYSQAVNLLNTFGTIALDAQGHVLISGVCSTCDCSKAIIIARYTPGGLLDTFLGGVGMMTSGPVDGLISGGCISSDIYMHPVVGVCTQDQRLLVVEFASGVEVVVANTSTLTPISAQYYYAGNNPTVFLNTLNISFYARHIKHAAARAAVLAYVTAIFDNYITTYMHASGQGWNLMWYAYTQIAALEQAHDDLIQQYPQARDQITTFFQNVYIRLQRLRPTFV